MNLTLGLELFLHVCFPYLFLFPFIYFPDQQLRLFNNQTKLRLQTKINGIRSNFSKTSANVSSGFQTQETVDTTRPQAKWFYCFRALGNLMKQEARVFENTSPTKKISLPVNYHPNKFSQFNYYTVFEMWNMHDPQKNVYDVHDPIT